MTKTAKDRDRALAMAKSNDLGISEADADADGDTNMDEAEETPTETVGSKVIVIHVGSQNLRIGLSSDALPKTIPMVIARKAATSESEDHEEPYPKRLKLDDGTEMEPEKMFGPEVFVNFIPWNYVYLIFYRSLRRSTRQCRQSSRHTCGRTSAGHCQTRRKW